MGADTGATRGSATGAAGRWARGVAWALLGAVLFVAPGIVQTALFPPPSSPGLEYLRPGIELYLWTSAIPCAPVAAALAYAFRDRLGARRRVAAGAAAASLVAYLSVLCAYHALLEQGVSVRLLSWGEWLLRYSSWCLWGAALVAWVLPAPVAEAPTSPLDSVAGAASLTEREREVAELLVTGCTQAQAAEVLGISASSVGTYRSRACDKLGVASLDELVPRELGASRVPPALDVGSVGSLPLALLALFAGMTLRLLAYAPLYDSLVDVGALAFVLAALGLPWALLGGYARLRGMGVRLRGASGRLVLLAASLLTLGLFFSWSGLSAGIRLGNVGLRVELLGPIGYAACVLALAPHLLWPREREVLVLDEERCVLYLRGRGAGELQARVLAEIAAGRTAPEICESLHVARGTVNAYRAQGYELLGVHSSRELTDLLAKDVGMIPSAAKLAPSADAPETTE